MLDQFIVPEPMSGCWIWIGGRTGNGYGMTRDRRQAHRVIYEREKGPIPEGLELDHLCRLPACVNPGHLEPVTRAVNLRRGKRQQFGGDVADCLRGHPATERYEKNGRGYCRACQREASRAWKRRHGLA